MKKMKKSIKGFTLTELAIVIAVIAILIAVLVPTFVSLINKANESNDKQLVKNLNTSLSTNIDIETPADALDAVAADGYSVDKLKTSSNCEIIYDEAATMFVLLTDGAVSYPSDHTVDLEAATTWYFVSSQSEIAENATVSYFISGDWSTSTASAQTAQTAKYSVKKTAATPAGGTVTYTGKGGVDTSRATGIATVNYTYTGTSTGATVILNVVDAAVVVDLSSATGSVEIKNYGNENSTIAVKGETNASVTLSNNNDAACYIQEDVSISYSGETEATTVKTVDSTSGTLEAGTEAYPYLLASAEDINTKLSYGGYYQLTASFEYTNAITIESSNEVTLDLNGYTLTVSGTGEAYTTSGGTKYTDSLTNNGTLTITDDNTTSAKGELIFGSGSFGIYNTGNFILANGKLNGENNTKATVANRTTSDSATVIVNSGTIYGDYYGINNISGTVEINGGTISGSCDKNSAGNSSCAIFNASDSSILNINSGTIYSFYGLYLNGGTVTIGALNADNSNINITGKYTGSTELATKDSDKAIYMNQSATLNIYSGNISGTYGIQVCGKSNKTSTLNVYGGYIEGEKVFAICGNGTEGYGYANIYIYGGTMTSTNAPAIYNPQQQGITYIYGGTITGKTGIEIRNSEVHIGEVEGKTIDPLVITATGSPSSTEENHSGSTTIGMAIAISTYNEKDITVTIGEGTYYSAAYSLYEELVTSDENTALNVNISVTVTGGTFTGKVYSGNKKISISGGLFTDNTDLFNCVAEGYTVSEKNADNYYEIVVKTTT